MNNFNNFRKTVHCLLFTIHLKTVLTVALIYLIIPSIFAQEDQASLLLDLKKTRASYEIAREKYENDKELLENKAISETEFNQSKNELLSKEVDYQKLILKLISEQSYVIVEKAIKYQNKSGERRVKVILRSTMEGNQEYLQQFEQHFDVFTPEMRTNRIYNVFVSLENMEDKIIIGSPYKMRIPSIELGKTAVADFKLLKDIESVQVALKYDGGNDAMNVYLEKDASANIVDIISTQFSQEADLGSSATYDLTLERFSDSDDIYQLLVLNLPRQVSTDFMDSETNSRLSQLKFNQGVNTRKLSLKAYLPDRDDEDITIDKPMEFYIAVLTRDEFEKIASDRNTKFTKKELDNIQGGKVRLELTPRGVGRLEVQAPSLYHEITVGDSITMKVTVRNNGTRRLDNIKISTDNPFHWNSIIQPDLIKSLDPEKEAIIHISIIPPSDVSVGAQEVKIKTQALADNRRVQTEDKTVRVQIEAKISVLWTIFLILLLIGLVVGIVVFGIKISKR
jgi:hypothetical protein